MFRKFFLRGMIFLGFAIVLWIGISHISPTSSGIEYRVNNLIGRHKDVEAITVGHSHNKAIDFSTLDLKGYHAWSGGSDLFEVEHLLHYLLPKLNNLRIVFIPIAYWNFRWDNSVVKGRKNMRTKYYDITNGGPIDRAEWNLFLKGKTRNIMRIDHWKSFIKINILGEDLSQHFRVNPSDGSRIPDEDGELMTYQELVEQTVNGPGGVDHHLEVQSSVLESDPDIVDKTYRCAERIIEYLQDHNIRVIFFTPPYFVKYTELYDRDTVQEMKSLMTQLVKKYSVEYYDFSADETLIINNRLFANDDHLNAYGAKVFSELLRVEMKSHSK